MNNYLIYKSGKEALLYEVLEYNIVDNKLFTIESEKEKKFESVEEALISVPPKSKMFVAKKEGISSTEFELNKKKMWMYRMNDIIVYN